MFSFVPDAFNYAAVFGLFLGIYLISCIDNVVREALTFVKGWSSV